MTHLFAAANNYVNNLGAKDVLPNHSSTIGGALANVATVVIYIIGSLSIVFIVVGGLQIVASAGSPQRFKQGRETVLYAVVGLIIAVAAYAIVTFISSGFSGSFKI